MMQHRQRPGHAELTTRSTNSTPSSAIIEPTDSSMPPVMMTKACADGEDAEQADQIGGVGQVDRRRKSGLMIATTVPTTRMRTKQSEIFLQHVHSISIQARSPTASCSTFCSLNCARSRKPLMRALMHHGDAVADADDLFHVAGDHQDGDARSASVAHQRVDLALGADIDAARRLIEDDDARVHRQPFGQHDLLLIAARKRSGPRRDAGRADVQRCRSAARRCAIFAFRLRRCRPSSIARRSGSEMFSAIDTSSSRPQRLRSSGTR